LHRSEEKFRNMSEAISDLFLLVSKDGTILNYKSHGNSLNTPQETFIGKNIDDILPTKVAEISSKSIKEAIETQEIQEFEYEHLIDDKNRYFEACYLTITPNQVAIVIRETTERRNMELLVKEEIKKLKTQDKIKRDLFLKVVYELKTLLVPIYGASDFILLEYKDKLGKNVEELLEMVNNGCNRMKGLIDKILGIYENPNDT